jgi:carbamoyltransferase
MTVILGISAYYHDAAAAIVRDGELVAAAEEERFSRRKHDASFPQHAINFCLEQAFIEPDEVAAAVFYEDPVARIDRVVQTVAVRPTGATRIPRAALGQEPFFDRQLCELLDAELDCYVAGHHEAHAASAFYPSPFTEAATLTLDGVGGWQTGAIGHGRGRELELLYETRFPHSLGLLYAAFTAFCGFRVNSDEYKLMGLAAYGRPRFVQTILDEVAELGADGSLRLALGRFAFLDGEAMHGEGFAELFGQPRVPGGPVTERDADLAASIQALTEEALLRSARHALALTSSRRLVLAGGVALNAVANGRLLREQVADKLWVQPAAGDAGGAIGAALLGAHMLGGTLRPAGPPGQDGQRGSRLGPAFSSDEVRAFLDRAKVPYRRVGSTSRARMVAATLAAGRVVGIASGAMEFGPRALGARSILADPREGAMRDRLNRAVKQRESFRPFAPAVLAERVSEFFAFEGESPYMLFVAPVHQHAAGGLGAVTHVDGSARLQTVGSGPGELRQIIEEFAALTGCPVVLNTSFNLADEPIVCSPEDAFASFCRGGLDLLVMEDCVVDGGDKAALPAVEQALGKAAGTVGRDVASTAPEDESGLDEEPDRTAWTALVARVAAELGDANLPRAGWHDASADATPRPWVSAALGEALRRHWCSLGQPGLAALGHEVARVAGRLSTDRSTAGVVEFPNLYPMF